MTVIHDGLTLEWYGYATVRLDDGDTTVYLDPGRYGVLSGEWEPDSESAGAAHPQGPAIRPEDGDIVCVTHSHHYDPEGIDRVASPDATIVAFEGINVHESSRDLDRLAELPYEVLKVGSEDERMLGDVPVWTVPAYNDPEGPRTSADGTPFHPKGRGCGFLFTLGETRVFWPGDTDVLEGHEELDIDVFLPPIGGAFTMDRTEAASLAVELDPELVVPIHYNTFDALETDSAAFAEGVRAEGVTIELDEGWDT
jgi:L-ascorbate metabolism protein UlaG (beta-lactamase superfamily)